MNKRVLQLSSHFSPNIGGVETHLSDLVSFLVKNNFDIFVLTYNPLTTKVTWKAYERVRNLTILRLFWPVGLFYKLVKFPLLEFMYLVPGLFLFTPLVILKFNPNVIHAHGLVAGFVGVLWGKVFRKRVVMSLHSIYHFPTSGYYYKFSKLILSNADLVLCLSAQSNHEVVNLGIDKSKVKTFTYWIDLKKFNIIPTAKKKLGWKDQFVCLFVGRLVEEKGILVLLEAAKSLRNMIIAIAGSGPLKDQVEIAQSTNTNIKFLGSVKQDNLPLYYSASDVVIVPSIHEEGFGRVILESLACGTPVIGSKRGAIPNAMDETVGVLIKVNSGNIKKSLEFLSNNPRGLLKLSKNTRKFAESNYSEDNAMVIIKSYED